MENHSKTNKVVVSLSNKINIKVVTEEVTKVVKTDKIEVDFKAVIEKIEETEEIEEAIKEETEKEVSKKISTIMTDKVVIEVEIEEEIEEVIEDLIEVVVVEAAAEAEEEEIIIDHEKCILKNNKINKSTLKKSTQKYSGKL